MRIDLDNGISLNVGIKKEGMIALSDIIPCYMGKGGANPI